jgi:large subunit ribosomal protein L17
MDIMRHNVRGRKLNRNASHRKAMFRNMVTSLFRHERIETTTIKAKECRSLAERLITYAKAGDLNSRRMAARKLYDPDVLKKLFDVLGPRYADRPGGYTRVLKIDGRRHGDAAEMAILELVEAELTVKPKKAKKAKAEPVEEAVVEETTEEVVEAATEEEPAAEAETEEPVETETDEEEKK